MAPRLLLVALPLVFLGLVARPEALAAAEKMNAERRVALVIGNNSYRHVPPLEKASNDARAVGQALERVGFATTILLEAGERQMNAAINRFVQDLENGGMGVLFFAGHGVQIQNQNFLLPVDFEMPQSDADVADQAVSLQGIQDKLALGRIRFTLLVIDACRDNPLPRKGGRSFGVAQGLAQASSAEGQIVVYSAGANQQALDNLGKGDTNPNGLFTREFLPWIGRPGVTIRDAMLEVRSAVRQSARSAGHDQFPAVYDQAEGDFYFATTTQQRVLSPSQAEMLFWQSVQHSELPEDFGDYLRRYPEGLFASLARRKMAVLDKAAGPPNGVPAPAMHQGAPSLESSISTPTVQPNAHQTAPAAPAQVIPLRSWDYEVIEQYGRNVVGRYRVEVATDPQGHKREQIRINNGDRTLSRPLDDGTELEMQVFRLPNDSNYWITDFSPYLAHRPLPGAGHVWQVTLPMGDMTPCVGDARVEGPESVKVPAGTFRATRIHLECRFQKSAQRSTSSNLFLDAWFVPEVGRVVRIDKRVPPSGPDDLGEERESYQLKRVDAR